MNVRFSNTHCVYFYFIYTYTVDVWNPNVWFLALFKIVRLLNGLDFKRRLKSDRILFEFKTFKLSSLAWKFQTELPKCPKSKWPKSEHKFVRFPKPNVWYLDAYCICNFTYSDCRNPNTFGFLTDHFGSVWTSFRFR